jgi:hypothetical protein
VSAPKDKGGYFGRGTPDLDMQERNRDIQKKAVDTSRGRKTGSREGPG